MRSIVANKQLQGTRRKRRAPKLRRWGVELDLAQ
jgi:hypothetical protein